MNNKKIQAVKPSQSPHALYDFRIMACSAPQWKSSANVEKKYSLDSRVPFSLQNAVRLGAKAALDNQSIWGQSNWSNKELLHDSVFILNYHDEEIECFIQKLDKIKPHVLFLGSMTLSFPGAISLATIAKQKMGNDVFIVLGGKHINETIYLKDHLVHHHPGSPVSLMQQKIIPQVFDLVVSGDGEEVVKQIGLSIGEDILRDRQTQPMSGYQNSFDSLQGKFILTWIENSAIQEHVSKQLPLDYPNLPSPVSLFGTQSNFPVFGKQKTAHVYSDTGRGCVFNCFFCSERSAVNGKVSLDDNPALRAYNQLRDASVQGDSMSAFFEDSILLTGNPKHLNHLAELLEEHPLPIVFGCQFTLDNVLDSHIKESILRLRKHGLTYIYMGMETANEEVALTISKNTHKKNGWIDRHIEALQTLTENNIACGVSVLWGLGENQQDRLHQLELLKSWQNIFGNPVVVSLNWATQHPLFDLSPFTYIDWGTDANSVYLPILTRLFGEASEKYGIGSKILPTIPEMEELEKMFRSLTIQNC